jgi:hypothetical protein
MIKNATTEDMKTLTLCLNKLLLEGYTEDFKASDKGLLAVQHEKTYTPHQVHVVNFYRFEGASDPADNSILYAIETSDGVKGTLVDAYGPYADLKVNKFMKAVEDISKKDVSGETDR